jgi:PAS domain S-box-containing protein
VNRAFQERIGKQAADIIGKKCWEITHRIASACYEHGEECAVRRVFESGAPHTAMHTHHDAAGKPLFVETKAFPLRDESGRIISAIEIINDVTDRKRLEDQLRHSQKMEAVGLLAGGISHDFNNILTAIIGYGNLLKMKIPSDGPLQPYVEQILASAGRAANLTQSLLAFSRKQLINPRPLDINESIRRFEKLLHRIIGEDVDIRTDLAPGAMTILADSSQIEQVLMNLATNARDAMPQGGTLSVRTETTIIGEEFQREHGFGTPGTYVCISMRDSGAGMDPKVLDRIFEPFFTTRPAGVERGSGLGLAISQAIVAAHQGTLTVESELGRGSTFRVELPAAPPG